MTPNLAVSQHTIIQDLIEDGLLNGTLISNVARCSERTISTSRTNYHRFGSTRAPYNGRGGRPRSINDAVLEVVLTLLRERPDLRLDEMVIFLWDSFDELLSEPTISRALVNAV